MTTRMETQCVNYDSDAALIPDTPRGVAVKRKRVDDEEDFLAPTAASKKARTNSSISSLQLSPLHVYALKGDIADVIKTVTECKMDVNTVDALGNSALHISAGGGSADCCSVLLQLGADKNLGNKNGLTPLHLSIRHNQVACFSVLINAGVDICRGNLDGITPLHLAAKYGRREMLSLLIERVPTLDFLDSWGQTPLHYTVLQKEVECARLLLERGATMPKDNIGMTPLLSAASVGATECVKVLLSYGASINERSRSGKTVYHVAAQKGHYECLSYLLDINTSNVNDKDKTGLTPLMEAQAAGFLDCIEILSKYGGRDMTPLAEDLKCPVCHDIFFRAITIACGHTFCRSCLQSWRKSNDSCPQCREPVRLVEGYSHNERLDNLVTQFYPSESTQRLNEQKGNSMECTIQNMVVFGKALGKEITLDKNHSCILAIDNEFPMHLTYLPKKNQLFIYAPIVTQFPKDKTLLREMYVTLLNESFLGNGFAGGGIGLILEKELVVFHCELDMCYVPPHTLKQTSVLFVEVVKRWRKRMNSLFSLNGSSQGCVEGGSAGVHQKKFTPLGDRAGFDNAEKNIAEFIKTLNGTVTVDRTSETSPVYKMKIQDKDQVYDVTVSYDPEMDIINVYSPVMDEIPTDIDMLPLYEKILPGSVFGFKTLHGGFGFHQTEDNKVKLMTYSKLKIKRLERSETTSFNESDPPFNENSLKEFMPIFIQQLEHWNQICSSYVDDCRSSL